MNGFNYFEQLYNFNGKLFYELQQLRKSVQQCFPAIYTLYSQIHRLNLENNMLHRRIVRMQQPVNIENLYFSHDINLDQLRVNSIQSGAALNVAQWIYSWTNSDMQMKMGSNSMNSGDCNEMQYSDDILSNENKEQP